MWLLRILLAPFAFLYHLVTRLRNHLYDIGYTKSFQYDRLVIGVGNLAVGGTGKTPMIEYLIRLLCSGHQIASLSRGYGRKSRGFKMAGSQDSALTIGDEPYQIYHKFGDRIAVAVGEDRALAISSILLERPGVEVVLLDDAFQHRSVRPQLNILLTSFDRPFYSDHPLPMGRLREARLGAVRADLVVVTKCPPQLSEERMTLINQHLDRYLQPAAGVYFSSIKYGSPQPIFDVPRWDSFNQVLLVSGIATSEDLEKHVQKKYRLIRHMKYRDHHNYSSRDLQHIIHMFDQIDHKQKCIITTEKDMVKWLVPPLNSLVDRLPVFYLPIEMIFHQDKGRFDRVILNSFDIETNNEG